MKNGLDMKKKKEADRSRCSSDCMVKRKVEFPQILTSKIVLRNRRSRLFVKKDGKR